MIKEEELPPPSSGVAGVVGGVPGGVAGGTPGGVLGGIIGSVPTRLPPPPPPPVKVEKPVTPQRITRRRQRAAGQAGPPAQAGLSAARQAGAHSGRGAS